MCCNKHNKNDFVKFLLKATIDVGLSEKFIKKFRFHYRKPNVTFHKLEYKYNTQNNQELHTFVRTDTSKFC